MSKSTTGPIDLGRLQTKFTDDSRAATAAERALKRAQDSRDAAKAKAASSELALRDATRAVLG